MEKSLQQLKKNNLLNPKSIISLPKEQLAEIIKSSGYYNQKSRKLKEFSEFFISLNNKIPSRESLLNIWGIGKESADSILLYAYKQPFFVIDNYTKKILQKNLQIQLNNYDEYQNLFHNSLPRDYKLFNEFHALIVAEGKIL